MTALLCQHCLLPLTNRFQTQEVAGKDALFCCYGCSLAYQVRHGETEEAESVGLLLRLGVGVFLSMNIMLFSLLLYSGTFDSADGHLQPLVHVLLLFLTTPLLLILGWPFMSNAWHAAWRGQLTTDSLVTLGTLAAYGYSVVSIWQGRDTVYFDTVTMVLVLFTLGRYLEALGRARAVRSLKPLLEVESMQATVVNGSEEYVCAVNSLKPGSIIRVKPGERLPVDGVVVEGESSCNEAILTGESRPGIKAPGSAVLAGSVNGEGSLLVRTTAVGKDCRWGQISTFVRESLGRKSRLAQSLDRVVQLFVPAVLLLAGLVVIYWNIQGPFEQALMHGLAVLVVACPCALGLAMPLAASLGLSRIMQTGGLARGGHVLEALAQIKGVALDKTGTLTTGRHELKGMKVHGSTEAELLARAAGLERAAEHSLAKEIVTLALRNNLVKPCPSTHVRALPGRGVCGEQAGVLVAVGNAQLMQELAWSLPASLASTAENSSAEAETTVYVGWSGQVRGCLQFADQLRVEADEVVAALQARGLEIVLLSGDTAGGVAPIADSLGIHNWQSGLSPEQKVVAVQNWMEQHGAVAMVGDGLNDGPVLALATVGIAMGSATDLARESADVVLPGNGLLLLPSLIDIARLVRRISHGNLIWALGYNLVALVLAALGYLSPVLAAGLMAFSSFIVVMNSLRLENVRLDGSAAFAPTTAPALMTR